MMHQPRKIAIVGGGLSGLALAFRLRQTTDAAISLFEGRPRFGGMIGTIEDRGFRVETGPNGIFSNKPSTINLCHDVGLGSQLLEASPAAQKNRYLYLNERLQKLPGSLLSFLFSPLLSVGAKWRLLTEKYRRSPLPLPEDETVMQFAERRAGKEIASIFARAMVTGIQAGDPEKLSLPANFPRLAQYEKEHGSVLRGVSAAGKLRRKQAKESGNALKRPATWSFVGGLQVMTDQITSQLQQSQQVTLQVDAPIQVLRKASNSPTWEVGVDPTNTESFDVVILTNPAYVQADLLARVDETLATEVAAIPYNRIAVVAMGYREADVRTAPHDGFGFIVPHAPQTILGAQWCSSIFPERAPHGCVLWRALIGGAGQTEMLDRSDDELSVFAHREVGRMMGFSAEPVFSRVVRWERAIPQYHVGHLARVARIEQQLQHHLGLFLGGNAYHGIAMNDCTEQADLLAAKIVSYLNLLAKS
ncbi:MAG: protoporphyrinogen oxidase [Zavarzinella sp.]